VWDIILLDKGTEVVVTLWSIFLPGEMFFPDENNPRRKGPVTSVQGYVQAGKALFIANMNKAVEWAAVPEGQVLGWNSLAGKIIWDDRQKVPDFFFAPVQVDVKQRSQMNSALDSLSRELLSPNQAVDSVLVKALASTDVSKAKLAIRSAAAVDDIQRVVDVLGSAKDMDLRWEAIEALVGWVAHHPRNDYILLESLQPTYNKLDAENFVSLLHRFSFQALQEPNTYELLLSYLENRKTALKELAHWHLCQPQMAPQGRAFGFNAALSAEQNKAAIGLWKKLIPPGSVPPQPK